MTSRYIPHHKAPETRDEPALWFAFRNAELLVCENENAPCLPCCVQITEHGLTPQRSHYLGRYDGTHSYAVAIPESQPLPQGWRPLGLRDAFAAFDVELGALAGRAFQILEWDRNHQYCSRCGTKTEHRSDERARSCPNCRMRASRRSRLPSWCS